MNSRSFHRTLCMQNCILFPMRRRQFLHTLTTAPAASFAVAEALGDEPNSAPSTDGFTLVSEFTFEGDSWKAWEDLRSLNGPILFLSARGKTRTLAKSAEPT